MASGWAQPRALSDMPCTAAAYATSGDESPSSRPFLSASMLSLSNLECAVIPFMLYGVCCQQPDNSLKEKLSRHILYLLRFFLYKTHIAIPHHASPSIYVRAQRMHANFREKSAREEALDLFVLCSDFYCNKFDLPSLS